MELKYNMLLKLNIIRDFYPIYSLTPDIKKCKINTWNNCYNCNYTKFSYIINKFNLKNFKLINKKNIFNNFDNIRFNRYSLLELQDKYKLYLLYETYRIKIDFIEFKNNILPKELFKMEF